MLKALEDVLYPEAAVQGVVVVKSQLGNGLELQVTCQFSADEALSAVEPPAGVLGVGLWVEAAEEHLGYPEIPGYIYPSEGDQGNPRILHVALQDGGGFVEDQIPHALTASGFVHGIRAFPGAGANIRPRLLEVEDLQLSADDVCEVQVFDEVEGLVEDRVGHPSVATDHGEADGCLLM